MILIMFMDVVANPSLFFMWLTNTLLIAMFNTYRKSSDATNTGFWRHAKGNVDGYPVGSSVWTHSSDIARTINAL
jgi:hypothetical protein